jgi:proteasome alpha subunit
MIVFTPYDWQEGIHNRAQYIESKLSQGMPVVAVSLLDGILVYTYRRQARKIFEIYDRIVYAGVGHQSDVESIRMAALEFASKEAFNRSEEDVNIQRVVTALSAPLKKAFSDFGTSPVVARSLLAEVGSNPNEDTYYVLEFDGDYSNSKIACAISGKSEIPADILTRLRELQGASVDEAMSVLDGLWMQLADPEQTSDANSVKEGLQAEAILLERSDVRENRFRLLTPDLN